MCPHPWSWWRSPAAERHQDQGDGGGCGGGGGGKRTWITGLIYNLVTRTFIADAFIKSDL